MKKLIILNYIIKFVNYFNNLNNDVIMYYNYEYWMRYAIMLASRSESISEIPVGAVLVLNNNIIGEGYNSAIKNHDPTAHAEIIALRQAGTKIVNYRLLNTIMYVTLEPCIMCAGAMIHARISCLVFGANNRNTGAAGSLIDMFNYHGINHRITVIKGILKQDCSLKIKNFFLKRRN